MRHACTPTSRGSSKMHASARAFAGECMQPISKASTHCNVVLGIGDQVSTGRSQPGQHGPKCGAVLMQRERAPSYGTPAPLVLLLKEHMDQPRPHPSEHVKYVSLAMLHIRIHWSTQHPRQSCANKVSCGSLLTDRVSCVAGRGPCPQARPCPSELTGKVSRAMLTGKVSRAHGQGIPRQHAHLSRDAWQLHVPHAHLSRDARELHVPYAHLSRDASEFHVLGASCPSCSPQPGCQGASCPAASLSGLLPCQPP